MKIFLVHPRGAPNRPNAAYARREDLPLYSTRDDEVVELDVRAGLDPIAVAQLRFALNAAPMPEDYIGDFFSQAAEAFEKLTGEKL